MPRLEQIKERYKDATINIALDTLQKEKQALVFCNTRRGAESQAEKIAVKIKEKRHELEELAAKALKAVASPTKQCKRLAKCLAKGIAFHHAGLHSKQRELVELNFRSGTIKIICSTPTLAIGMDLPAYRAIVRDLKRFSSGTSWGMVDIPVLEYHQQIGRAGRPGKDDVGEGICIASNESNKEKITEKYIHGDPEEIYSKLAVEPVLRTYVLSLIASEYVHDTESLYKFFDDTFYAWQYGDTEKLHAILDKMVKLLSDWQFIEAAVVKDDFVVAGELVAGALSATKLGNRVAELYLDPLTAHHMLDSLRLGEKRNLSLKPFPLLHLLATTLEMRPLLSVRQAEFEEVDSKLMQEEERVFVKSPSQYSHEYDEYLQSVKTATVLEAWIHEVGEDILFEKHKITPGDLYVKKERAEWLLYSLIELSKLLGWQKKITELEKLRVRVMHGVKEEVLPLLRLKGVGRVRARKLFANKIRTIGDIKKTEFSSLRSLLGEKIAVSVKEQVGQKVQKEDLQVKLRKRKGQVNLKDF
ncbi:MAG: helicase-related protein [Candidatus Woesearchaeota archaeon]|nr:helicase-related protein [Candidatus Woesearchaeota archaeon]